MRLTSGSPSSLLHTVVCQGSCPPLLRLHAAEGTPTLLGSSLPSLCFGFRWQPTWRGAEAPGSGPGKGDRPRVRAYYSASQGKSVRTLAQCQHAPSSLQGAQCDHFYQGLNTDRLDLAILLLEISGVSVERTTSKDASSIIHNSKHV